jgi:hypothetical protein
VPNILSGRSGDEGLVRAIEYGSRVAETRANGISFAVIRKMGMGEKSKCIKNLSITIAIRMIVGILAHHECIGSKSGYI